MKKYYCVMTFNAVAFKSDISVIDAFISSPVPANSVDFASLMFVLSAIGITKNYLEIEEPVL